MSRKAINVVVPATAAVANEMEDIREVPAEQVEVEIASSGETSTLTVGGLRILQEEVISALFTLAHDAALIVLAAELSITPVIVFASTVLAPSFRRTPDISPVILSVEAPPTLPLPPKLPSMFSVDAPCA